VGIDGFRAIAERTGVYDGQDEPAFEYDAKGQLRLCKVAVYRKDVSRPFVGIAHFGEYAQRKKDGALTRIWAEKPHVMLAKCAEALAFRKGFPEDTSGLYTAEEMPHEEREVNPPPDQPAASRPTATSALKAKLALQAPPRPSPPQARKMPPIIDVVDEQGPPPPGDADAPFGTGPEAMSEPRDDGPEEEEKSPVVVPFGKNKGTSISDVDKKELAFLAKYATEAVANPEKARFQAQNQALLEAVRAEQARR
jgi:hypothetical protein